jgi:fucose 4-O-acetylase-like acetyltransferase
MTRFIRRFIGVLVLDPVAFEDVESDRHAGLQAAIVVLLACIAGGVAAVGSTSMSLAAFATGALVTLGAWVVWALVITTIGTHLVPEPQTDSQPSELLRTIGFATAPGVFSGFAAIRPAAPFVFVVVSVWLIAATVVGVRQALDYRSLGRAVAVCVGGFVMVLAVLAAVGALLSRTVS